MAWMAWVAWDSEWIYGVLVDGGFGAWCHVTRNTAARCSVRWFWRVRARSHYTSPGSLAQQQVRLSCTIGIRFFGNPATHHSILRYSPLIHSILGKEQRKAWRSRATDSLESSDSPRFDGGMEWSQELPCERGR